MKDLRSSKESGRARTVRLSEEQWQSIESVLGDAISRGIKVQGDVNLIRPKESHVLRLAIELGLPHVVDELQAQQENFRRSQ